MRAITRAETRFQHSIKVYHQEQKVRVGCQVFKYEQLRNFFEWYFFDSQDECRFLLWNHNGNPKNCYIFNGRVTVYRGTGGGNIPLSEESMLRIFILLSEELKL